MTGLRNCTVRMPGYYYLGVLLSDDTAAGDTGPAVEDAVQLALVEINASGGIGGKTTGMVRCSAGSMPSSTVTAAEELAKLSPLSAIIGPGTSSGAMALMPSAKASGVCFVSPSATSPELTTVDDGDLLFRTIVSDTAQGQAAASMAKREGYRKPLVVHRDDAYGRGLAAAFLAGFGTGATSASYTDETPPASVVSRAKSVGPDAVFLVSFLEDGVAIVKEAMAEGFAPVWIFAESMQDELFIEGVGNDAYLEGALGTAPAPAVGPNYDKFASAWRYAFATRPKVYTPNGYDATYLLAAAMMLSGVPDDRQAVHDHLRKTGDGPAFGPGQWPQFLGFASEGSANYEGASGPVDFDANGDVVSNISEWTIKGGKLEVVGCFAPGAEACQ